MAYLNPQYNGKVGVYRTNEIERFGTAPVSYDIYADEYFAFKFTATAKLATSPLQTAFVYYSSISGVPTGYYVPNIAINNSALNEPSTISISGSPSIPALYELNSLSWGGFNNYLGVAKQIAEFAGSGNWNFTVGSSPPTNTETDQTDLTIGNSYWFISRWSGASFNLQTTYPAYGSAYQTTCKVIRGGVWATASTSAYFNFQNIS